MLTGVLSDNNHIIVFAKSFSLQKVITLCICTFIIITTSRQWVEKTRLENALAHFLYKDDTKSLNYIHQHYSEIKNSADFILRYARILYLKGEYQAAIPIMKHAISLYPTTNKYCELGDIYQSINQYGNAERAYKCAIHLLPFRIYPHYCLFLLYKEAGLKKEATAKAHDIMKLSPKKENQHYMEIISQEKQWISCGYKTANDYSIKFENVPKGALYWLQNLTTGKEERIFTYENGQQRFW